LFAWRQERAMTSWLNWFVARSSATKAPARRPRAVVRRAWSNRLPAYSQRAAHRLRDKPTLQARALVRSFGEGETKTRVLHGVSIELYRGELSLLMGPSGSGKSTLMSIISGLMPPDSGQVLCLNEDFWRLSSQAQDQFRLRHFGHIFQGYNLFPALTARQQLEMVLRWGEGVSSREARQRAEAMLTQLGLGKKTGLRPGQMSGGEKQRVAIGRALIKQPDFCFADEPSAALDWEHGRHVIELLRRDAHERAATVVVVTHDPRLIPYADRVFYLADGHLVEEDPHHTEDHAAAARRAS
jgi:putative ABC transport system ATP-binding protein